MMWGKVRPVKDEDKRTRCPLEVKRRGHYERCSRLARKWATSHQGTNLGEVICCQAHADSLRERGFTVIPIDRRKRQGDAA